METPRHVSKIESVAQHRGGLIATVTIDRDSQGTKMCEPNPDWSVLGVLLAKHPHITH